MKEQHSYTGRALHVPRLRYKQVGLNAMFGLNPLRRVSIKSPLRADLLGDSFWETQIGAIASDLIQTQEEFRNSGGAATLADVVPKARRLSFRDSTLQNASRRSLDPIHPRPVASYLIQTIEQTRGANRSVTPPYIEEVFTLGLVVKYQTDVTFSACDCLKILCAGKGSIKKLALLSLSIKRSKKVSDTGCAVREVGHQTREAWAHRPLQSILFGLPQLDQPVGVSNRKTAKRRLIQLARGVKQKEPDARAPRDNVSRVIPLNSLPGAFCSHR